MPQAGTSLPHEIDHIRAVKHHGPTTLDNTCWACAQCNGAKGSNVAGFDPETDTLVPLFNPREAAWSDHFAWEAHTLVGRSPIGRATIEVLRINDSARISHRELLAAEAKREALGRRRRGHGQKGR